MNKRRAGFVYSCYLSLTVFIVYDVVYRNIKVWDKKIYLNILSALDNKTADTINVLTENTHICL